MVKLGMEGGGARLDKAPLPGAVALVTSILTAPVAAAACGACTDAALLRSTWLVGALPHVFLALAFEVLAFAVYCSVCKAPVRYKRRKALAIGAVAISVLALFMFNGSIYAVILGLCAVFAYSLVRSVIAERGLGRAVLAVRAFLVSLLIGWAALASPPTKHSTDKLVRLATTNPPGFAEVPSNWVEFELVSRPDARQIVESRLRELRGSEPSSNSTLPDLPDLALLRLHRLAGGDASFRSEWCRRWDFSRYQKDYRHRDAKGEFRPSLDAARALCPE